MTFYGDELPEVKEQTAEAELAAKEAIAQRKSDIEFVLSDPRGRRFLNHLLTSEHLCHVHGFGFVPSGSAVYFNEGKRAVGLKLKETIEEVAPTAFLAILNENVK